MVDVKSFSNLGSALRCYNCDIDDKCNVKEAQRIEPNPPSTRTYYCMRMVMERGTMSGDFKSDYGDSGLVQGGLSPDGCRQPNDKFRDSYTAFSNIGGYIKEVCLCKENLCNGGPQIFLSWMVLALCGFFLMIN